MNLPLSQILITDEPEVQLPPYIQQCIETTKTLFSNFPYTLYTKETLREFIDKNFDADVLNAYDRLKPYAYKSDLGRYCILYELGGWYFDIAIRPQSTLNITDNVETLAFRDIGIFSATCWACYNGLLYAQPKSPVYWEAIQLCLKNFREEFYGVSALSPTGPNVLGRAFCNVGESPKRIFGDLLHLTPSRPSHNPAFVLPDGAILAWGKPKGPDGSWRLQSHGFKGGNDYSEMFLSKDIYEKL